MSHRETVRGGLDHISLIPVDRISDCWVIPGSSENGNILWVTVDGKDMIVGGYSSLAEAKAIATDRLGWAVEVLDQLAKLSRLKGRRARANADWRSAILEAHAAGLSLRRIGDAAGVSHVRVLQIVRGE